MFVNWVLSFDGHCCLELVMTYSLCSSFVGGLNVLKILITFFLKYADMDINPVGKI